MVLDEKEFELFCNEIAKILYEVLSEIMIKLKDLNCLAILNLSVLIKMLNFYGLLLCLKDFV